MPAGPMPLGFLYFAGAKLAGYSGYSKLFLDELDANEEGNSKKPSAFLVGLARTALGIAVGAAFGLSFFWLSRHISEDSAEWAYSPAAFYCALIPVRFLEWKAIFVWLRRKYDWHPIREPWVIAGGIVVSFLLDAVGVLALWVLPGGAW